MAGTEKQKQSLYFPEETLREIMKEAIRLDRSLSLDRAASVAPGARRGPEISVGRWARRG